jgi:hypothetical protein
VTKRSKITPEQRIAAMIAATDRAELRKLRAKLDSQAASDRARKRKPTPQEKAREKRRALARILTFDVFVDQRARLVRVFFDKKEWASLIRHRKHMTPKGREKLVVALRLMILKAEQIIDKVSPGAAS